MTTIPKPSIGGQAVIEGVMMRGPKSWAVAVRKPDHSIVCETYPLPDPHRSWLRKPMVRGVHVLVQSLSIGIRALRLSAAYAMDAQVEVSSKSFGWTLGIALVFFSAIFIVVPAALSKYGGRLIGLENELLQNLVEGFVRLSFFVGYILLISLIPDIKRVFQYHGAEHKTIYAYENEDPMDPDVIDRYSTLHVRCGTNFLFIVLFMTIAAHFVLDILLPASIPLRLAARIMAIPLLAGVAYEVIKGASKNERSRVFRLVSLPGIALQKITTRPPTRDQIEVAVKAMEAVMVREGLADPGAPSV